MSQSHSAAPPGEEEGEEEDEDEEKKEEVHGGSARVKMKGWQANEGEMEGWVEGRSYFFFN